VPEAVAAVAAVVGTVVDRDLGTPAGLQVGTLVQLVEEAVKASDTRRG